MALGTGCASFKPEPVANVRFRDRALKGDDEQYHVEVAEPFRIQDYQDTAAKPETTVRQLTELLEVIS